MFLGMIWMLVFEAVALTLWLCWMVYTTREKKELPPLPHDYEQLRESELTWEWEVIKRKVEADFNRERNMDV